MELLAVRDVSFSYSPKIRVFNDFSAQFEGHFFGLIGPNGAGKTTLLKLALGLLQPEKGEILVSGTSVNKYRKQVLQQVGILHENPQFPSWTEVFSYLRWVGTLRGLTRKEATQQAMYLLELLGLLEKRNALVKHMSAGQQQRFGIAQALIGLPKLIFLDEPTANLDVHYRNVVFELLKKITTEHGTGVLVMSHVLSDLERFCDNYAILYNGEIRVQGAISELLQSHHHEYVLRGPLQDLLMTIQPFNVVDDRENAKARTERVRILKQGLNELVIWVSDPLVVEKIKENLPQGSSLAPYRSLLEEKFLEIVGSVEGAEISLTPTDNGVSDLAG